MSSREVQGMHQNTTVLKSEKNPKEPNFKCICQQQVALLSFAALKMVAAATPTEVDCVGPNLLKDRLLRKYQ